MSSFPGVQAVSGPTEFVHVGPLPLTGMWVIAMASHCIYSRSESGRSKQTPARAFERAYLYHDSAVGHGHLGWTLYKWRPVLADTDAASAWKHHSSCSCYRPSTGLEHRCSRLPFRHGRRLLLVLVILEALMLANLQPTRAADRRRGKVIIVGSDLEPTKQKKPGLQNSESILQK